MSDSISAVEITTLAAASIAVVLAAWSLGWHLWSRRRLRSRIKVSGGHGMVLGSDGGELAIIVRVENTGSLPVGVMGWGLRFKRRRVLIPAEPLPASTDDPLVLRPGEDASFFVSRHEFDRAASKLGSSSARPFVTVATGTVVRACRRSRPIDAVAAAPADDSDSDVDRSPAHGESRSDISS